METPHSILKKFFGYDSFRPGQEQIVQRLLAGQEGWPTTATWSMRLSCAMSWSTQGLFSRLPLTRRLLPTT